MVEILEEEKIPLSADELSSLLEYLRGIVIAERMKEPGLSLIIAYREPERFRYMSLARLAQIKGRIFVGQGVIAVRGGVLPNVFIEDLMAGYFSLSMLDEFGIVREEVVEGLLRKHFLPALIRISRR